ncbi:DoxX family protein [Herbidospora mongoliensis]|uniref:DoxX family protein n=1 Tax=Herbidospora mongoliensis TaxID=688067 RepID=UPI000834A7E0|nr:DoxX family protein [Herbidospora mongoliensis]
MKKTFHDLATLAARIGVGGIFFANGWAKLRAGLDATETQFTQLDAPIPEFWAAATMLIELLGGTLLIAGAAVKVVGVLLFAEALAVFILAAGDTGLPLTGGSVQLVVALGAASVLLSVNGAGRLSVDQMVIIKRRDAEAADEIAADMEADNVINALREPTRGEPKRGEPTQSKPSPDSERTPEKTEPHKGPVTFPNQPEESTAPHAKPKPVARKPRRDTTTESRSEPAPGGGEPGDTLVAGRRSGKPE